MSVATEVLGRVAFGPNSDIYKKLIIQEQKVQSFSADFGLMRDPGLVGVFTLVTNPADLAIVEAEIEKTVEKFRGELCDETLLEETKSAMKYGFLMSLETAQGVSFALRPMVAFTGEIGPAEDYYRTLDSIIPEDILAAAKRYLVEQGRTTVTLLPAKEDKR